MLSFRTNSLTDIFSGIFPSNLIKSVNSPLDLLLDLSAVNFQIAKTFAFILDAISEKIFHFVPLGLYVKKLINTSL